MPIVRGSGSAVARTTTTRTPQERSELRERAWKLGLYGLVVAWDEVVDQPWVEPAIVREEKERHRRTHDRRIKRAHIGRFKPIADFEWTWPRKIDREQIEELFTLKFLTDNINPIFVGPAVLAGHTVLFTTASRDNPELALLHVLDRVFYTTRVVLIAAHPQLNTGDSNAAPIDLEAFAARNVLIAAHAL